jgi:cyanophycinase
MFRTLLLTCLCASLPAQAEDTPPKGHLVVVGGGNVEDAVLKRALELAGGAQASIVILPQASELPESGEKSAEMWRSLGATSITVASDLRDAHTRDALAKAAFIWMPGGQQTRLMQELEGAEIPAILRARYKAGAVIGGTSAGAAVMSALMITGETDLESITPEATKVAAGLGLWPEVIVDQHFLKRQRFNRLLAAVLDHPDKIGVGIDEGAAVFVSRDGWEVRGGKVLVIDARPTPGASPAASTAQLRLLDAGTTWKP